VDVAAKGRNTGTSTRADGRYTILGLEVGAQYTVSARGIGYPQTSVEDVRVQLGQNTTVDMILRTAATQLSEVTISAQAEAQLIAPERRGTATPVADTLLRRLPTLNRHLTAFTSDPPQLSTP